MNTASSILEKIARLTRVVRLKRHASAIADSVGAMSPTELLQLRVAIEAIASCANSAPDEAAGNIRSIPPDRTLDELSKLSVDRQLNSDSAIVRIRYIARWLVQTIRLSVGQEGPHVRAIYRKAVTVLRSAQNAQGSSRSPSWFIANDKKAS